MSATYGKKLALLLIKDYFLSHTDEKHKVTSYDILDMLEKHGITADRSLIYRDINLLKDEYGMDIALEGKKYYAVSRDFELEEVKLLADMVQSSNFITHKKAESLLHKIEGLASIYQAEELHRKFFIRERTRNTNESIFIIIDTISKAIDSNVKIEFQYFSYNLKKEKELRHNGKVHVISPYALIWVDQNYYMLGYDSEYHELRHYRIDRMTNVSLSSQEREGKVFFDSTDMATYTEKTFYMFRGEEKSVTLRCQNYVADAIIDRFGDEVMLIPDGEDYFNVTIKVLVSTQFFAWLSPFGEDIEIIRPVSVRDDMYRHFARLASMYSPK